MAQSICSIPDCAKPHWGRGWCRMHYTRWRTHGDPLVVKRDLTLTAWERFEVRVDNSGGPGACWPWKPAQAGKHGYFSVKSVDVLAHRWLWAHLNGPIPDGMVVRHKCDNPPCVNPAHLELGSQLDNINDREVRDRTAKGVDHYLAKLNPESVRDIRQRASAGESRVELAQRYDVSRAAVRAVVTRRSWKHVT